MSHRSRLRIDLPLIIWSFHCFNEWSILKNWHSLWPSSERIRILLMVCNCETRFSAVSLGDYFGGWGWHEFYSSLPDRFPVSIPLFLKWHFRTSANGLCSGRSFIRARVLSNHLSKRPCLEKVAHIQRHVTRKQHDQQEQSDHIHSIAFFWPRPPHVDYATQFLIAITTPTDERCCKKRDADENSFVSHLISRWCVEVFSLPVETVRDKTQSFRTIDRSVHWRMKEKKIWVLLECHRSSELLNDCGLVTRLTQDLLKSNDCRSMWGQGQSTVVDWSKGKAVTYAMGAFLSDYRCSRLEWILFRFALSRSLRLWCVSSLFTSLRVWEFPSYSRNS